MLRDAIHVNAKYNSNISLRVQNATTELMKIEENTSITLSEQATEARNKNCAICLWSSVTRR